MVFIQALLLTAVWSCQSPEPAARHKKVPLEYSGIWINQSWLDSLAKYKTARFIWTHGLTDVYIFPKLDSALIADGEWPPHLVGVKTESKKIKLCATSKDSCHILAGNTEDLISQTRAGYQFHLTRPDTEWLEKPNTLGFRTASRKAANHFLMEGKYMVLEGPSELKGKEVSMDVDGKMQGMDPYRFYDICYSGDCKRYCDEMDLVYFSPLQNEPGGMWYGWQWRGNKLEIYSMRSLEWMSNWPDIQPVYRWLVLEKK